MDTEKHGSFRLSISARITRINTDLNEKSPPVAGYFIDCHSDYFAYRATMVSYFSCLPETVLGSSTFLPYS